MRLAVLTKAENTAYLFAQQKSTNRGISALSFHRLSNILSLRLIQHHTPQKAYQSCGVVTYLQTVNLSVTPDKRVFSLMVMQFQVYSRGF